MLLLVSTLSLIKITQGYSLKKPHLSSSIRMRLLDKKPCLNGIAWHHSTATPVLLVTSSCGYLSFALEISWPNRKCVGSTLPRVQVSMWPFLHSPLVSPGVLCLVTAFSGVHGLDKG